MCISDTHSRTRGLKYPLNDIQADILIHAGDFTMRGADDEIRAFNDYLGSLTKIKHKVVIAGNHDLTFDSRLNKHHEAAKKLLTNCIYLQDCSVNLMNIKIHGSPWQPLYGRI